MYMAISEFVGEIVATKNAVWAGYDLGGAMANNLMLVVWPNGSNFVYSTRMAECVPDNEISGRVLLY